MEEIRYCWAKPADLKAIQTLLKKCELPHEDVSSHLVNFITAKTKSTIIGVNGIEIYGQYGLLRSLAVDPAYRGRGISRDLNANIIARAHQAGVKTLYLFTETAERYAAKLGFSTISRESVPESIQGTTQFRYSCPKTATCMLKEIEKDIHYYPSESL